MHKCEHISDGITETSTNPIKNRCIKCGKLFNKILISNNNEIPRFAPLKDDWKGQMEQKIEELMRKLYPEPWFDKSKGSLPNIKNVIEEAILFGQSHMKQRALHLITEEIADSHTEGTPTSRLTSLYNKLSALNDLKI